MSTPAAGPAAPDRLPWMAALFTAVPMLGMLRRKAEHRIVDTALKSLKRRVEGLSE